MNKIIVSLALALCAQLASATTIEQALWHYGNGEFAEAYKGFTELAAIGNHKAQYNIAVMYARGEHVETDFVESFAWFKLVEANGSEGALEKVMNILRDKLSDEELKKAQTRFAELLDSYGNKAIQENFYPGIARKGSSNFEPAKCLTTNQADYPRTMLNRGFSGIVDMEYMVEKDGTVRYPTVLASSGDAFSKASVEALLKNTFEPAKLAGKAVHQYGRKMRYTFHMADRNMDKRFAKREIEELKSKAEVGGGLEKYNYAYTVSMLQTMSSYMGGYDEIQEENPNPWFSSAARDGFSPAKYELGKRLAYGQRCGIDVQKSLFWLEQAAEQGLAEAQFMLGLELISGARTERNPQKGLQLIRNAAERGIEHAMLRYAWIVSTDKKAHKDELKQARTYLKQIKEKEYPDKLSLYETQVALHLAVGDMKPAIKAFAKSQKYIEKNDLKAFRLTELKKALNKGERYIESI